MEKRQCMKEVEKNLTITAQGNSIKTAYGIFYIEEESLQ